MAACQHMGQFRQTLTCEKTITLTIPSWKAVISITCSDCGTPFLFQGLTIVSAISLITTGPGMSTDQKALYAPISPNTTVACPHTAQLRPTFLCLRDNSSGSPVWKATMTITCSNCATPFKFNGLSLVNGLSQVTNGPATSTDQLSMYAPIAPAA